MTVSSSVSSSCDRNGQQQWVECTTQDCETDVDSFMQTSAWMLPLYFLFFLQRFTSVPALTPPVWRVGSICSESISNGKWWTSGDMFDDATGRPVARHLPGRLYKTLEGHVNWSGFSHCTVQTPIEEFLKRMWWCGGASRSTSVDI